MGADYDLVVVGNSLAGRWAALTSARQHARTALVVQNKRASPAFYSVVQDLSDRFHLDASNEHWNRSADRSIQGVLELQRWCQIRCRQRIAPYALKRLAYYGVDVVEGSGSFLPLSHRTSYLTFEVDSRELRSRRYLLALEAEFSSETSPLAHASATHPWDTFLSQVAEHPKTHPIRIEDSDPSSLLLGQILNQLGYSVTIQYSDLLPYEDQALSFFMQCYLEGQGIKICKSSNAPLVDCGVPKSWQDKTQSNTLATSPSTPLIFHPYRVIPIETLGLTSLPQFLNAHSYQTTSRIPVQSTLQTLHPHIYACGPILGGYTLPRLGQQEASVAIENGLFHQHRSFCYSQQAYQLPVLPGFARIGLSEKQARQTAASVKVLTRTLIQPDGEDEDILFCKLVAQDNGSILGLHLIGRAAQQSTDLLERILQQACHVKDLKQIIPDHPLLAQMLMDFVDRWETVVTPNRRDRLETYFRTQRNQFS